MPRTSFDSMPCPVARGLDRVGEGWSILILRNAFHRKTRCDQIHKSLGIAPNILSRRLRGLVEAGLFERVRYNNRPPRDDSVWTAIGRDFRPVLRAMVMSGHKRFMPDGQHLVLVDGTTGRNANPVMMDGNSGKRMDWTVRRSHPGPNPTSETRSQS